MKVIGCGNGFACRVNTKFADTMEFDGREGGVGQERRHGHGPRAASCTPIDVNMNAIARTRP